MMKKEYLQPIMNVLPVLAEDILTTSPNSENVREYDFAVFDDVMR